MNDDERLPNGNGSRPYSVLSDPDVARGFPPRHMRCARAECKFPSVGTNPNNPSEQLCSEDLAIEIERRKRWMAAGAPSAEKSMERIAALTKLPKPTAIEHWQAVVDGNYPETSKVIARAALHNLRYRASPKPQREPGED